MPRGLRFGDQFFGITQFRDVGCVQVQSLLVVGHFIQSFNPITNRVDYAKRVLPDWLKDRDITDEYMDFASEWGELLHWGLFEKFNGEVDRCLWKSFGQDRFLSKGESRYRHFQVSFHRSFRVIWRGSVSAPTHLARWQRGTLHCFIHFALLYFSRDIFDFPIFVQCSVHDARFFVSEANISLFPVIARQQNLLRSSTR
ncbi:hypothetical protein BDW59DRAFT_160800 [Aspergillus cavernicola]|uniref:Uncharacterized protein n=1 Tax=Aspergillus cavernicola TaxID=176166 RepID=A0ABR4IFS0_9EURO